MRFSFAACLIAFCLRVSAEVGLSADYVRVRPTAVPVVCSNGDLRIDSGDSNKLKVCRANVWTAMLESGSVANNSLSNLSATAVNQNLIFDTGSKAFLQTKDVDLSGDSKALDISTGYIAAGTGYSGQLDVHSGLVDGTGHSGQVSVYSEYAPTGAGFAYFGAGSADTGAGGQAKLFGGNSQSGSGGDAVVTGGDVDDAAGGDPGDVLISPGRKTAGNPGKIYLFRAGEGTAGQVWTSTDVNGAGHWAAVTASFAAVSGTASYASVSGTASFATASTTASSAGTASFASVSGTASFATASTTASFAGLADIAKISTAFAATPTGCSATQYAHHIAPSGNLTCAQVSFSDLSGTASIAQGGTNNGTLAVTAGGMLYTDGSKVMNMGAGTAGQTIRSAGAGTPAWRATIETIQKFTSGSGTYTTPTNALYIKIRMIGGGGGGGGSGTAPGTGTDGTQTTISTLIAGKGTRGGASAVDASSGGDINFEGTSSARAQNVGTSGAGAPGVAGVFGGPGRGGTTGGAGGNASTNTGSGGGGAGTTVTANPGNGGGAGGYVEKIFSGASLFVTAAYTVGSKGTGGTAGGGGFVGGDGADGIIVIEEFY
jgi:hypothetical protein